MAFTRQLRALTLRMVGSAFLALLAGAAAYARADATVAIGTTPADTAVTWAQHIAPIVYRECTVCHNPAGSAPFSLLEYEDARRRAGRMARAVTRRFMPPWLPEPAEHAFRGERRLTDAQIAAIVQWAEQGAPAGQLSTAPRAPIYARSGWQLGEPDLVIDLPVLEIAANAGEVYRNIVLSPGLASTEWIEAVELLPGGRTVHHARLMVDSTAASRTLDAQDDTPGFDGMHAGTSASNPEGFFVGWTPGRVATRDDRGLAWPLKAGADLVLQLHLRPSDEAEVIRARIGLHFADAPPAQQPSIILLGSNTIDIPAGATEYTITDEYTLPVAVDALGLYPHAHYLAQEMIAYAILPDGATRNLLHIRDWDFNWQDEYRFATPVRLPAGTRLGMRYTYDNSARNPQNPNDPPRRVVHGPNSTDEMGDLVVQVLAASADDRERLERDIRWTHGVEQLTGRAQHAHVRADSLLAAGMIDDALAAYRETVRLTNDPAAMSGIARIMLLRNDAASAILAAERAVTVSNRNDPRILGVLAAAYRAAGRQADATAAFEEAVRRASALRMPALADSLRSAARP